MEARNRNIGDWYGKIQRGEIKLPRFQRYEAWDKWRIESLINTVTQNLPLGITLVLEVGENEQFISRYLSTAPETQSRVTEHLLDGQQRLTALWRVLNNNYEYETYYVYCSEFDILKFGSELERYVYGRGRYYKNNGAKYPLWCDNPSECLKRGLIPTELLRPVDLQQEINSWVDNATNPSRPINASELETFFTWKQTIVSKIITIRSQIKNYNLPYLALPTDTSKDVALEVFINMNTNSKPLSQYDIIVAEVEGVAGKSLHDLQGELDQLYPDVKYYGPLPQLILTTSALMQDKLPNQKGAWDMDKIEMINVWGQMTTGLNRMSKFMYQEGIIDQYRLPTNAVLAVIAALYRLIPENGDLMGVHENLLKKYIWTAFFTDRYENSAATHAYYDYIALKRIITETRKDNDDPYTLEDVPLFNRIDYPLEEIDELLNSNWPKNETIRGRAILCIACKLGSLDFASGQRIDRANISSRHYHHIFPDALLKEANIESYLALNCALISDVTNWTIGRKEPLQYLKDRYRWLNEGVVNERLNSHLIPIPELTNGGYESCQSDDERKQKIKDDFSAFLLKRAKLIRKAVEKLTIGEEISSLQLIQDIN